MESNAHITKNKGHFYKKKEEHQERSSTLMVKLPTPNMFMIFWWL